jgi:hypothetical protein
MTKADFNKKVKVSSNNLDKWILNIWGSYDEFHNDVNSGDVLEIPVNALVPRTFDELNYAKKNNSFSDEMIELTRTDIYNIDGITPEMVIYDGHNRLMDLDINSIVRIKIRD